METRLPSHSRDTLGHIHLLYLGFSLSTQFIFLPVQISNKLYKVEVSGRGILENRRKVLSVIANDIRLVRMDLVAQSIIFSTECVIPREL